MQDPIAGPRATDGLQKSVQEALAVDAKVTLKRCRFLLAKLAATTDGHRSGIIPRNEDPGAGCISVAAS